MRSSDIEARVLGLSWECQPFGSAVVVIKPDSTFSVTSEMADVRELTERTFERLLRKSDPEYIYMRSLDSTDIDSVTQVYSNSELATVFVVSTFVYTVDSELISKFGRVLLEGIELLLMENDD